jgi:hypothetical protein
MNNKIGNSIKSRKTANDVIYTPLPVAKLMIEMCEIIPKMSVLDPSKGGGVFYDNLPECNKDYCEITENKDFFDYDKKVDLIIGNPPYSLWNKWIEHTMKITDKFCYIFGIFNFTDKMMRNILDNGFVITKFHLLSIDWWFGRSFIIVFERNNTHIVKCDMTVSKQTYCCDICNKRCKRGRAGFGMNECSNIKK